MHGFCAILQCAYSLVHYSVTQDILYKVGSNYYSMVQSTSINQSLCKLNYQFTA
jgi:hypothetical protein